MREIKNVRQERLPGRRRWFESDALELVVWLNPREQLTGFQLCYDRGGTERALTWRAIGGFAHDTVDQGNASALKNCTPILRPDGVIPWQRLIQLFDQCSANLEPELRAFVLAKLSEGANR